MSLKSKMLVFFVCFFNPVVLPPRPTVTPRPGTEKAKNLKNDARPKNVALTYTLAIKVTIQCGMAETWLRDGLLSRQS